MERIRDEVRQQEHHEWRKDDEADPDDHENVFLFRMNDNPLPSFCTCRSDEYHPMCRFRFRIIENKPVMTIESIRFRRFRLDGEFLKFFTCMPDDLLQQQGSGAVTPFAFLYIEPLKPAGIRFPVRKRKPVDTPDGDDVPAVIPDSKQPFARF